MLAWIVLAVLAILAVLTVVASLAGSGRPEPAQPVPLEQWIPVANSYLQALADGDPGRAFDHVCHTALNPTSRREFVAYHRDTLRPASWQLEHGFRPGGTNFGGPVTFADGRSATIAIVVYDPDDPGVCFLSSRDPWARDALDPTPIPPG